MKKELRELLDSLDRAPEQMPEASNLTALSELTTADQGEVARRWAHFPVQLRRKIGHLLKDMAEADARADFDAVFRLMLDDPDEDVRMMALDGLWEDERTSLVPALIRLLRSDPSVAVRASAAVSLGRFAMLGELEEIDAQTTAAVRQALLSTYRDADEDTEVRRRAVEAVACMGGNDIAEIIEASYRDKDERMLESAIFAMGRSCDERWAPTVKRELRNARPEVRYEAARAAGELEMQDGIPTLLDMIDDSDPEVREAAIEALGKIGGDRALETLLELAQTGDESLRLAALDALETVRFNDDPLSPGLLTWLFSKGMAPHGLSVGDLDDESEDWDDWESEDED